MSSYRASVYPTIAATLLSKIAYPMLPATEPYFMVTATEIVRVGERGYLSIYAENGYATSRNNTIVARIYKENEPEPVKTVGFDTSRPGPTVWAASPYLRCCVRPWNIRCGGGRDRCHDRCDFYQTYQQAHNRYPALAPVMKRLSISSPTPRLWVEPRAGL